jgi:hypothetical protein
MTCTTFLHDSELNQPLPNAELQKILEEVRERTGKNWQVVPTQCTIGNWPCKKTITLYGVYVYVGGCGPWQQINFYTEFAKSSINLFVTLDLVAAYLFGLHGGSVRA